MEALATVAPRQPVTSLRSATAAERLRAARTCCDHLAGRLGVALSEELVATGSLRLRDGTFSVTRNGEALLRDLGVHLTTVHQRKRAFPIPCLDWTERRARRRNRRRTLRSTSRAGLDRATRTRQGGCSYGRGSSESPIAIRGPVADSRGVYRARAKRPDTSSRRRRPIASFA
jgi:hypothetical protein